MIDNRSPETRFLDDVRELDLMLSIASPLIYELLTELDTAIPEGSEENLALKTITADLSRRTLDQIFFALDEIGKRAGSLGERAQSRLKHLHFRAPDPFKPEIKLA